MAERRAAAADPRPAHPRAVGLVGRGRPPPSLLIFAKEPVPGRVKTRLTPALTPDAACAVYRHLLERAIAQACAARDRGSIGAIQLWCTPEAEVPYFRDLAREHRLGLRRQADGDLGARMRVALAAALASGARAAGAPNVCAPVTGAPATGTPAGVVPAMLIGTDCPGLDADVLAEAGSALAVHDAVFVPTNDGGYALVGLRRPLDCFEGIAWSTPSVMAATRERLVAIGARWRELPALGDVDTDDDLERWLAHDASAARALAGVV